MIPIQNRRKNNTRKGKGGTTDATTKSNRNTTQEDKSKESGKMTTETEMFVSTNTIFIDTERKKYSPGFFIPKDLKKFEIVLNCYVKSPDNVTQKSNIIFRMIHLPSIFLGREDVKIKMMKVKKLE